MVQPLQKFLVQLKTNPVFRRSLIIVLVTEIGIVLLLTIPLGASGPSPSPLLEFDPKVGLALFTGIPLFLITVIQLQHNSSLQRSSFIKDFAARIHNERDLSEAFYYLAYTYSNDLYREFKAADESKRKSMQADRKEGMRLYIPTEFQFSEEERRLDALLGFFNVLGYHHHRGVVHMQDIAGVLGFHLAVLSTRQVIKDYRQAIPSHWAESSFTKQFESVAPHRYLDFLLHAFEVFSRRNKDEIRRLNELQY